MIFPLTYISFSPNMFLKLCVKNYTSKFFLEVIHLGWFFTPSLVAIGMQCHPGSKTFKHQIKCLCLFRFLASSLLPLAPLVCPCLPFLIFSALISLYPIKPQSNQMISSPLFLCAFPSPCFYSSRSLYWKWPYLFLTPHSEALILPSFSAQLKFFSCFCSWK